MPHSDAMKLIGTTKLKFGEKVKNLKNIPLKI